MTTTTDTEVPDVEIRMLSAIDRCDRCGAQALLAAEFSGAELLFCAHHANDNMPKLKGHITLVHHEATLTADHVTAKS